ncbi:reverse transcriptase (RNA-dependent DNA polymerase) domain-containing protein [Rhizophagus clarus]|uniref:Reverse transcriptase (RNA-dependent DNA polymerase) domain-containing protein n=2 Tax=Rhizophagus clarus TaxID=94130 RepID=A0A8H3QFJ2_9GLOM|nr:reverse transcriptase (RNA-dependent DNA polymerase) domain-containing protein [Rhizophagus clarus]
MEQAQGSQNTQQPAAPVSLSKDQLLEQAFSALYNGNADPNAQGFAAQELKRLVDENQKLFRTVASLSDEVDGLKRATFARAAENFSKSRSTSPALDVFFQPSDEEQPMVIDKPLRPKLPVKKAGNELLHNTKAMKLAARNLVSRLAHLRTRLVKLNGSTTGPAMKKFYQFRLISEDSSELKIYEENKKDLDDKIGRAVLETLKKDVAEQIQAVKSTLNETAPKLTKELEELRDQVLQNPDLSTTEKETVKDKWKTNITYNVDWLNAEILKLQTSQVPKVSKGDSALSDYLTAVICHVYSNNTIVSLRQQIGTPQTQVTPVLQHGQEKNVNVESQEEEGRRFILKGFEKTKGTIKRNHQKIEGRSHQQKSQVDRSRWQEEASCSNSTPKQVGKSAEKGRKAQAEKYSKRVFVNVASQQAIKIPSYVFSTLNLGANFQLISSPSLKDRQESWQGVKKQIQEIAESNNSFIDRDNFDVIMDAVQVVMINDPNYFNKNIASNKSFRQAVKFNKLVKNVFDFLNANELMCILADKNLGLTIIDKSWYIKNMQTHFAQKEVFDLVATDRFDVTELYASALLQSKLRVHCSMTTSLELTAAVIDPHATQLPLAYGLIKLHKSPYKLRIITPVTQWINVKAAVEVTKRLGDYVKLFNHVLTNSSELVRELDGHLAYDFILASFDVSDMYNSIGQADVLDVLQNLAHDYGWWTPKTDLWWKSTIALIEFVFETSYVGFGGHVFKQKRGLPMGSPMSPVLANLYMAGFEDAILQSMNELGVNYYRYLDDIFMIMSNQTDFFSNDLERHKRLSQLGEIVEIITTATAGSIKFEQTGRALFPGEYVEYLDLKIWIRKNTMAYRNKVIQFELFDKPTNLHIYTDPSTFYPFSYVYNWIQGENIRLIRNSSSSDDYDRSLREFRKFLVRRKYSEELIDRFVSLNYYGDRNELLDGAKPHKTRENKDKDLGNNRYISVRNSGSRPLLTSAILVVDNFVSSLNILDTRLVPVVQKGKSIVSVMNQAKKNLSGYNPK